jgi:alanine-glyoxylate transaminase/serine-glyoxylate transaminase/serine-pyruvate transaminase
MNERRGRHFLQIPGPSPVPERIRQAMDRDVIDHRGPEFGRLGQEVLEGCRAVFQTSSPVIIYPSSGTGAWEAAIANVLQAGDTVLTCDTGYFAEQWRRMAMRWGLNVETLPGDWRRGVDADAIEARLREDREGEIKAVMVVHNETSTGVTSDIAAVRQAIDASGHPALLMVDVVSSLGCIDFRHEAWGVDVAVAGSQKGLMLPPGLSFNAVSEKALAAARAGGMPRSYWDWGDMLEFNARGYFPYTPATSLLFGLKEAIAMLREEGLEACFARHQRLAAATRAAVRAWGLEILCLEPTEYSAVVTAVVMPADHDADAFRRVALERYDLSLGAGLGRLAGRVFRIGHLGDCSALTLVGALAGVEMGFAASGVPHRAGGVSAAMAVLEPKSGSKTLSAVA